MWRFFVDLNYSLYQNGYNPNEFGVYYNKRNVESCEVVKCKSKTSSLVVHSLKRKALEAGMDQNFKEHVNKKRKIEPVYNVLNDCVKNKMETDHEEIGLNFDEMLENILSNSVKRPLKNPKFENHQYDPDKKYLKEERLTQKDILDCPSSNSQTPQTLDFATLAKPAPHTQTLDFAAMAKPALLNPPNFAAMSPPLQMPYNLDFSPPFGLPPLKTEEAMDFTAQCPTYSINFQGIQPSLNSLPICSTLTQPQGVRQLIQIPPYQCLPERMLDPDITTRDEALSDVYTLLSDHSVTYEAFNEAAKSYFEDDYLELEDLPINKIYEVIDNFSLEWGIDDREADPGVEIANDLEYEFVSKEDQIRDFFENVIKN